MKNIISNKILMIKNIEQKNEFTIGAFAIIFDDQKRVLLCHRRDYDLWNLPGGTVETDEAPWEAVVREVKEEVGLDVRMDRLAVISKKYGRNNITFTFICNIVGGEIIKTDEADQIEYFNFEDIPEKFSISQRENIKDILDKKDNNGAILKVQRNKSSIELVKELSKKNLFK